MMNDNLKPDIQNRTINNMNIPFIAGASSGILLSLYIHPIDLIKTQMQGAAQKNKPIIYPIQYFRNKFNMLGVQYFYSGYFIRILGIMPVKATYWGTQGACNEYLKKYDINNSQRLIASGIISAAVTTVIDNPIEALKTRIITDKKSISKIISRDIFYKGFAPNMIKNIVFSVSMNYNINLKPADNYFTQFFNGGLAGLFAGIITQPIDYIKTERQRLGNQAVKSSLSILKTDYNKLMIGVIPRSIMCFFYTGIGATTYLFSIKTLKTLE